MLLGTDCLKKYFYVGSVKCHLQKLVSSTEKRVWIPTAFRKMCYYFP